MAGDIKLTGIVLSSMPIDDYDRRVSLLTCEKGRISAFVRNARRPMSSLRAVSMPFTYGRFSLYASRDSYSINGCEDAVYFDGLSKDIEKTSYGMYFCELLSFFTRENLEEKEQVKLLFTALKALLKDRLKAAFIRRIFEIRALANYGEAPNVFECAACGKKAGSESYILDVGQRMMVCRECASVRGIKAGEKRISIPETVRYSIHYCITAPYKSLFGFELVPDMEVSFKKTVDLIMKNHVDKPLKTLELLEALDYNES